MNVVTESWYSHNFLIPVSDRSISDESLGGTAHHPHVTGMWRRRTKSRTIPVPMASNIERLVMLRTVPFHFDHSHSPAGSYSHTTGRFDCWVSAHSVNRFRRPLSDPQPTSDGIPMASNQLRSLKISCANNDRAREDLFRLCNGDGNDTCSAWQWIGVQATL